MSARERLTTGKKLVVKLGSSLVADFSKGSNGINVSLINSICKQLQAIHNQGTAVVVISSGAIASGMSKLHIDKIDRYNLVDLQTYAAIGQSALMNSYDSALTQLKIHCAQVLITHADLDDRQRYLNARATFMKLLELRVIPIVNENDTVSNDEIKFGDNDTLAALISNLISADVMIILTDQEGLLTASPQVNPSAQLIRQADVHDEKIDSYADIGTKIGRGGMKTKISAARSAARSATQTVIANGMTTNILLDILNGKDVGTYLTNSNQPQTARKNWIVNKLKATGTISLDEGAVDAIANKNRSLLFIGTTNCQGNFRRGEVVNCVNQAGKVIAKGISNYNTEETNKLLKQPSCKIASIIGYEKEHELIHRDNLVIL